MSAPIDSLLRIGAFSRRVGVSAAVLRAWESRYGLFTPTRTPGGFRLYSPADERRARRMVAHLEAGLAARESAELVLSAPAVGDPVEQLVTAWQRFDADAAHGALDALLSDADAATVTARTILPALTAAASGWRHADLGPAQVHFAARLLEARLLALGGRWHEGPGPLALVGCGPGEQHTLGAVTFALALHARGWRIAYLGADAPVAGFVAAARALEPARVVVAITMPDGAPGALDELRGLPRLALAGPAISTATAQAAGGVPLAGDPASAAAAL